MVFVKELREAWRRLAKRPGYALLSVLVLGVGLGFVVFLFGAVDSVALEPYPFPHAERLVAIGEPALTDRGTLNYIEDIDSDQYLAMDGKLANFDSTGAYTAYGASVDLGHGGTFYIGSAMTASLQRMLGAKPLLGRSLAAADDAVGAPRVVVLSERLWRHAFGANPKIIGRRVRISGKFYTVVGVMRESFRFPVQARFWTPLPLAPEQHRSIGVVARLARGATLNQARAELDAWKPRLQRQLPPDTHTESLVVGPVSLQFTPNELRRWVWVMFGAGMLVLLLAAVNVANLEWVKTVHRRYELALRSALGCSRLRLLLGPLVQSWLIGVAALVLAFVITWGAHIWFMQAWVAISPTSIPYLHGIFTTRTVLFALLVAFATTSLASGLPAWRASRRGLESALRDESKGTGRAFARVARVLVAAEVVLTVVLLVGAGSFIQAMRHVLSQPDVGATHATHVLTAKVDLPAALYETDSKRIHFFDDVVQRLQQDPRVVAASATNTIPGAVLGSHEDVSLPGHGEPAGGWPRVQMGIVGPAFLETFGVHMLEGRFIGPQDDASAQPVVVIDARTAARFWPHKDALNRRLVLYPDKSYARTVTVIGVVQSLRLDGPLETPKPAMLIPLAQSAGATPMHHMRLAVRVHGRALAFRPHLTHAAHGVDTQAAVFATYSQAQTIAMNRAGLTVLGDTFAVLGAVSLLLAAAGLYGILAFSVAQRTREIGIRRAIGAGNRAVAHTIGRQLAWQLGIGLVVGFGLAVPWSSLLAVDPGLHIHAHDPAVFATVLVVVLAASLLAALVPLVRALRVDPAVALRYE